MLILFNFFVLYFLCDKEIQNFYLFFNTHDYNVDLMIASLLPLPLLANSQRLEKVYNNLYEPEKFRSELHRVGGVYGLINTYDNKIIKQYIGSSKDLYQRLMDHLLCSQTRRG